MKVNIGIVGYGNLGKAVEQNILSDPNLNLVAIFSRRLVKSKFNVKIEPYDRFLDYKNKIDVMLLCGGSKSDLEFQTPEILKHFDVINTFDTHAKIVKEYTKLSMVAKSAKHRAIICCGWDPGLFSVVRCLFLAIGKNKPLTFWGKGVSMGHSDAIRQVAHVDDVIQFTVPVAEAIKNAKKGTLSSSDIMHERVCFVAANEKYHGEVERQIKNIPNYFKGQPTKVNFVTREKIVKLKRDMRHKGFIFESFKTAGGFNCKMEFSASMKSNPEFTASIMVAYINAVINLKNSKDIGVFTTLDIPVSYLFDRSKYLKLLNFIC